MKKILFQMVFMMLCALVLCGCVCDHTHVPGRVINHPAEPDSTDAFFCVLDYMLFTPDGQWRESDQRDAQIQREQQEREAREAREQEQERERLRQTRPRRQR